MTITSLSPPGLSHVSTYLAAKVSLKSSLLQHGIWWPLPPFPWTPTFYSWCISKSMQIKNIELGVNPSKWHPQLPSEPHDIFKQRRGWRVVYSLPLAVAGLGWDTALTGAIQGTSWLARSLCSLILGLWERSLTSLPAEPSGHPANGQAFRCLLAVLPDTHEAVLILWTTLSSFWQSPGQTDQWLLPESPQMPPFCHLFVFLKISETLCFHMLSVLNLRKQADAFGSSWANSWAQNEALLLSKSFYHLPCWDYLLPCDHQELPWAYHTILPVLRAANHTREVVGIAHCTWIPMPQVLWVAHGSSLPLKPLN